MTFTLQNISIHTKTQKQLQTLVESVSGDGAHDNVPNMLFLEDFKRQMLSCTEQHWAQQTPPLVCTVAQQHQVSV